MTIRVLDRRALLSMVGGAVVLPSVACASTGIDTPSLLSPLSDLARAGPPQTWVAQAAAPLDPGLEALFLEGLPYKDGTTRVFAVRGRPQGAGPHPGIVLVHGGGGTAYVEWVRRWVAAGFAAISVAVEGQTDAQGSGGRDRWVRHEWAGPARDGIYGDIDRPVVDQWMFHAVGAAILARNLLKADPSVVSERVGLCGTSWGGVITATTIGLVPDFAFAIPIYGAGYLDRMDNQYAALARRQSYATLWEPGLRLARYRNPSLWINWPGDQHFSLDVHALSYGEVGGVHAVALRPGMRHNHSAGWSAPESYAFARSVIETGAPWGVMRSATIVGDRAQAEFSSSKPLVSGELVWSPDQGHTGQRAWTTVTADVRQGPDGYSLSAPLPAEARGWFINAKTDDLILSSDFQSRQI